MVGNVRDLELGRVKLNPDTGLYEWTDGEFQLALTLYTDPDRLRLARNAARYLGKADVGNTLRPLSILKAGHVPEIFRGEHAEFEYDGITKEVYDHLITYTTRDMRVAGGNRALKSKDVAMPSDRMGDPNLVRAAIEDSFANYNHLLDAGETRQVARNAMPVAAKMNTFVYQWNFLTLGQSLFNQRIWDTGAQGNTVRVVRGMWALCYKQDAALWDAMFDRFGTPAIEWAEIRSTFAKRGLKAGDLCTILDEAGKNGEIDDTTPAEEALRKLFGKRQSMW